MANTTTSQLLINGERNAVVRLTCLSDGTPENGVVKVDATKTGLLGQRTNGKLVYPNMKLRVEGLFYDVKNMTLRIQWEAMPNADILIVGNVAETLDFGPIGGIGMPTDVQAPTGSIAFTTVGAIAGASYTVILRLIKDLQP